MNSSVECEKTHGLDALLSGYFCQVSDILSKKSGYLDHLDGVFLCFEIASLWLLSLFSVRNKFDLSQFYLGAGLDEVNIGSVEDFNRKWAEK